MVAKSGKQTQRKKNFEQKRQLFQKLDRIDFADSSLFIVNTTIFSWEMFNKLLKIFFLKMPVLRMIFFVNFHSYFDCFAIAQAHH